MTTKQIAEYIQKPEKTVRTWTKKASAKLATMTAKLAVSSSTHPADYDLEETVAIIETGLGANAAAMYRANARTAEVVHSALPSADLRLDRLENMVEKLVLAVTTVAVPPSAPKTLPAPVVPDVPVRTLIKNVVNDYAVRFGDRDFQGVWGRLYKEFGDRFQMDVGTRAKNRGIPRIDYLDQEGLLEQLYAVAILIFGRGVA